MKSDTEERKGNVYRYVHQGKRWTKLQEGSGITLARAGILIEKAVLGFASAKHEDFLIVDVECKTVPKDFPQSNLPAKWIMKVPKRVPPSTLLPTNASRKPRPHLYEVRLSRSDGEKLARMLAKEKS